MKLNLRNILQPAKWFRPANDITDSASIERVLREVYGGGESAAGVDVTPDRAMRLAAVYTCVKVISESLGQIPVHEFVKGTNDNSRTRMPGSEIEQLINVRPNQWQTGQQFVEMLTAHACLRGRGVAWLNRVGPERRVVEMIPLHPDRVRVEVSRGGVPIYCHTPAYGPEQKYLPSDILDLKAFGTDPYQPLSPISQARDTLGLAMATEQQGSMLFRQGMQAVGFLKHPGKLDRPTADAIGAAWSERYSGVNNAFKTPILDGGMDYVKLGMTAQDSQFLETRKFQRSEIAAIFRVPPHMVGDLERATFSNIEHQSLEFVQRTLLPWVRRWELAFLKALVPQEQWNARFMAFILESLLRGDVKSRYEAYGMAIKDGWMTRNEARERENLNPLEGLDLPLRPLNMGDGSKPPPIDAKPAPVPAPVA